MIMGVFFIITLLVLLAVDIYQQVTRKPTPKAPTPRTPRGSGKIYRTPDTYNQRGTSINNKKPTLKF